MAALEHQSLEQKRAARAWADVETVAADADTKLLGEYYSVVRQFPSTVQSIGLGQSAAFLMVNANKGAGSQHKAHAALLRHISNWLLDRGQCKAVPWPGGLSFDPADDACLLKALIDSPSLVWWHADQEAIDFGVWLKRFAEARHGGAKLATDREAANARQRRPPAATA